MATPSRFNLTTTPASGATPGSVRKQYDALVAKYGVTQKIVLAQNDYIKDLEQKNASLTEHAREMTNALTKEKASTVATPNAGTGATREQVMKLQQGVKHFRDLSDQKESQNSTLRRELQLARAQLAVYQSDAADGVTEGTKSVPGLTKLLQTTKRKHAAELAALRTEVASLEEVVEKNQTIVVETQQKLADERRQTKQRIETGVQRRVDEILNGSGSDIAGDTVEVAALRGEVERLRKTLASHDADAQQEREDMVAELNRLRGHMDKHRSMHEAHTGKLNNQLSQTAKLMDERELIIAEERQAFEAEIALVKETARRREAALRSQIDDLNRHAEALTTTLAMRPEIDEIMSAEGLKDKSAAQISAEYEAKLRSVLQLKEEGESRLLAERDQLLSQIEEAEKHRSSLETLREADFKARITEKDHMLAAWEKREEALLSELEATNAQMRSVQELAVERERILRSQLETQTEALVTAKEAALRAGAGNDEKTFGLESELQQLQDLMQSQKQQGLVHATAYEEQNQLLQQALQLAEKQVQAFGVSSGIMSPEEATALKRELRTLRETSMDRRRAASEAAAGAMQTQGELRRALSEAVDQHEASKAHADGMISKYGEELTELRQYLKHADESHSSAEELSAREIRRLSEELDSCRARLKDQRHKFESIITESETRMQAKAKANDDEAAGLRKLVLQIQKSFQTYRMNSEKQRQLLVKEQERLQSERVQILETQVAMEERHKAEVEEMSVQLQERREAFEDLEREFESSRRSATLSEEELRIPILWKRRQDSANEAAKRTSNELEMLREQLASYEARLKREHDPVDEELRLLRNAQTAHESEVRDARESQEEEVKRLQQEIDTLQERVAAAEGAVNEKTQHIVKEIEAIEAIRERCVLQEQEQSEWWLTERQLLSDREERRSAEVEQERSESGQRVAALESQLEDLLQSLQDQKSLAEAVKSAADEQTQSDLEATKQRAEVAEQALSLLRTSASRQQENTEQMELLSATELQTLRNQMHHLRRRATEQQLAVVAEKKALLDKIDRLTGSTDEFGKSVTFEFRKQMEAAEKAAGEREAAMQNEIDALQSALARERQRAEERARNFSRELQHHRANLDHASKLQQVATKTADQSKEAMQTTVHNLTKRCRELEQRAEREKLELEVHIGRVREHAKQREEALQRELIRRRNDFLEELQEAQQAHDQKVPDMADSISRTQQRQVEALKEENELLALQLERTQQDMQLREEKMTEQFMKLKEAFSRFRNKNG